jgi:hypothetical protein
MTGNFFSGLEKHGLCRGEQRSGAGFANPPRVPLLLPSFSVPLSVAK